LLARHYDVVLRDYGASGIDLPKNKGKIRSLDRIVINSLCDLHTLGTSGPFQTVRGPFLEGSEVYPTSGILRESHIQIAVRDRACILGVFRPNQNRGGL
jgi:hypothetical protein